MKRSQSDLGAALYRALLRVEQTEALDSVADRVAHAVARALRPGSLKDLLAGRWLGHSLHPLLTDFADGAWIGASFLDLFGPRGSDPAAQRLVGFGLLACVPTVLSGLPEWVDGDARERRVGLAHMGTNASAILLYSSSYLARRRAKTLPAILLGIAGGVVAFVDGYVGGHLSHTRGVGVGDYVPTR